MIEILEGFPDDVLAMAGEGKVTRQDYLAVVQPALRARRRRHAKLSLYYELGPRFNRMTPAAAFEDVKTDISNWRAWRRIALVSDAPWITGPLSRIVRAFHKRVRFFPTAEADAARAWVMEAVPGPGGARGGTEES